MGSSFLLINKPVDWTSHDVVAYVRNIVRSYYRKIGLPDKVRKTKVGHAGTLDPFATGLIILGIGHEATKRLDEFKALTKTYITVIKLGAISTTYDKTGVITTHDTDKMKQISEKDIKFVLNSFIGKQTQISPMYSAKKVGGKKLYELARKGIEIERQPHEIEIYSIKILQSSILSDVNTESVLASDSLQLEIKCSTGTYIRAFVHDIGQAMGTDAYCEELERTQIGNYKVEDAIDPKSLNKENLSERLLPVSKTA